MAEVIKVGSKRALTGTFLVGQMVNNDVLKVILYQNTAEDARVDKTNYLTIVSTVFGVIKESSSITDLSILVQYDGVPNFNYVYIDELNRYYFVSEITTVSNNLWEISLSEDGLMTYKDGIYNLNAFVDRNENTYSEDIIDKKVIIEQGYDIEETTVTNNLFDTASATGNSYILVGFALKTYSE